MARILLVRHGQAAASFTDDADPGLDKLGIDQARAVADQLRSNLPLLLISSPLKRARETAAPLLQMQVDALSSESIRIDTSHVETLPLETLHIETLHIETRMSEIPSPGLSLSDRGAWLGQVMQGQWSEQSGSLSEWRTDLISCLNEHNRTASSSLISSLSMSPWVMQKVTTRFLFSDPVIHPLLNWSLTANR